MIGRIWLIFLAQSGQGGCDAQFPW